MTRVAVVGALGRMGSTSVAAIGPTDDLEIVAQVDRDDSLEAIAEAGAEVALVFSTPDVALDQVRWLVDHDIHVVVGTSGFDQARISQVREALSHHPGVGVLVVPNFSIGAVLTMKFAAVAAPFFESIEIIEMHHPDKVDAPSGTAVRTAEVIAEARDTAQSAPLPDATTTDPEGARGARIAGIPVHSVRARGFTASQDVLFGAQGEVFSLRHDSSSRESFMPGVLAALRAVTNRAGVTIGLDSILGL